MTTGRIMICHNNIFIYIVIFINYLFIKCKTYPQSHTKLKIYSNYFHHDNFDIYSKLSKMALHDKISLVRWRKITKKLFTLDNTFFNGKLNKNQEIYYYIK